MGFNFEFELLKAMHFNFKPWLEGDAIMFSPYFTQF
jgi:hypothetical protein